MYITFMKMNDNKMFFIYLSFNAQLKKWPFFFFEVNRVEWSIMDKGLSVSACLRAVEWFSSYANFPVSAGCSFNGFRRCTDYRRKFTGRHNFRASRCAQKASLLHTLVSHSQCHRMPMKIRELSETITRTS